MNKNRFEKWQNQKEKKLLYLITSLIIVGGIIFLIYALPTLFVTGNILDRIVGGIFSLVILVIFGSFLKEMKNDIL